MLKEQAIIKEENNTKNLYKKIEKYAIQRAFSIHVATSSRVHSSE